MHRLKDLIDNPSQVARELRSFSANVRSMDAQLRRLQKKFPNQYVAFHNGRSVALAKSMKALLQEVDRLSIPRENVATHFLGTRTMILKAKRS